MQTIRQKHKTNRKTVAYYNHVSGETSMIPISELSPNDVKYLNLTNPPSADGAIYAQRSFVAGEMKKVDNDRPKLSKEEAEAAENLSSLLDDVYPRSELEWKESVENGTNLEGWGIDTESELRHWSKACEVIGIRSDEYSDAYSDQHCDKWIDQDIDAYSDYLKKLKDCFSVILACHSGWPNTLLERLDAPLLSTYQIEKIAERYWGSELFSAYEDSKQPANQ